MNTLQVKVEVFFSFYFEFKFFPRVGECHLDYIVSKFSPMSFQLNFRLFIFFFVTSYALRQRVREREKTVFISSEFAYVYWIMWREFKFSAYLFVCVYVFFLVSSSTQKQRSEEFFPRILSQKNFVFLFFTRCVRLRCFCPKNKVTNNKKKSFVLLHKHNPCVRTLWCMNTDFSIQTAKRGGFRWSKRKLFIVMLLLFSLHSRVCTWRKRREKKIAR